jgi:hypothetical protein
MTKKFVSNKPSFISRNIKSVVVGALLSAASLYGAYHVYTNSESYLTRQFLDIERPKVFEEILLENTKEKRVVEKEEINRNIEKLIAQFGLTKENTKQVDLVDSTSVTYIGIERNLNYCDRYIEYGKDSISNIFSFVNSPYVKSPVFNFIVPRYVGHIKKESLNGVDIYLVSKVGTRNRNKYNISLKDGHVLTSVIRNDEPAMGINDVKFRVSTTKQGFEIQKLYATPIFGNTSAEKISKAETMAIEALHVAIREYTSSHFAKEIVSLEHDNIKLDRSLRKWTDREETLVHGISILWLQQYNKEKHLGLSQKQLDERISWYSKNVVYRNVVQFSKILPGIGVSKAVELYVNNPDELFKGFE